MPQYLAGRKGYPRAVTLWEAYTQRFEKAPNIRMGIRDGKSRHDIRV